MRYTFQEYRSCSSVCSHQELSLLSPEVGENTLWPSSCESAHESEQESQHENIHQMLARLPLPVSNSPQRSLEVSRESVHATLVSALENVATQGLGHSSEQYSAKLSFLDCM